MIDFDDKDIAMVCITIIAIFGGIIAIVCGYTGVAVFAFLQSCITGLAALATGRKNNSTEKQVP